MFALFNLGAQEIVILAIYALFLSYPAVVLVRVLRWMLRKKRPIEPEDGATRLERAHYAAAVLTPEECETLCRWLEEQRPPRPPAGGEGITQ